MPKLNAFQWFVITVSVLGFVSGSTAQLTEIFGAGTAHTIITVAGLANGLIGAVMAPFLGNASMAKGLVAPGSGVQLKVTTAASPALIKLALDPSQPNIGPANPADRSALEAIAKG